MEAQYPKVQAIYGDNIDGIIEKTNQFLEDGWQLVGPFSWSEQEHKFYRELIKFPTPPKPRDMSDVVTEQFYEKMSEMDQKVKDLLEINNIMLICDNGKFFTSYDGKVTEGISPMNVLNLLRSSKHCPTDLDEKAFLSEIESVL